MRRRAPGAVLTVATAAALALTAAPSAFACSCAPPDPEGMLRSMDGAFTGRLVEVRLVDLPEKGERISTADRADFVYRIGAVYKGRGLRAGRRVRVRSVRSEASCGLPRTKRRAYGVFLIRRNGRWSSNLCLTVSARAMRRAARASRASERVAAREASAPCRSRPSSVSR